MASESRRLADSSGARHNDTVRLASGDLEMREMMAQSIESDRRPGSRKPDIATAMRDLIRQVRAALPFDTPESQVCSGACQGCSRKLLDFLESELEDWETRLNQGEKPGLGDLSRLIGISRKVRRVLTRNGLLADETGAEG